jgi:hypothetical protein
MRENSKDLVIKSHLNKIVEIKIKKCDDSELTLFRTNYH